MNTLLTEVRRLKKQPHSANHRYSSGLLRTHNQDLSDTEPDLNQPQTFQRLLDCLSYALAIDDSISLAPALGMPPDLNNQMALSIWVRNELSGMQFLDSSALFNYLVSQLNNLTDPIRSRHGSY